MEIENMLKNIPKFNASPMFKDQLHDRLVTEIADREQTKWRFGWKLASMIIALILVVGFGSIFLKNYFGRDFLRPSKVMAAEIIKKSLESFFRKQTIYHQITKQFLEGKTEPIVYEIWEDNDAPRFLNHVTYPASVSPPDGQESWQGFFIATEISYWWEIDIKDKTIRRENYIYSKEEDRWKKLDARVDVPRIFNDLIEKGILETKEGRLDKREVYVVYDTRTDPDKYWDILTFDKNTFQLLRTEKYEGEGDKRKLTSLVEYELQESIPATPDNIDKFFKSYPIETKYFKYLQRDFYVNEGGAKEDFREIISETPFVPTPSPDEIANWKTYTDPILKFSIQYPNDMTLEKMNNDIYLSLVSFKNNNTQFSVYVRESNVENEVKLIRAQTEGHVVTTLVKNEAFQINGTNGWLLEYTPQSGNINRSTVIIPNKTNVYVINSQSDVFDQILSTFKFLDQGVSD